MDTEQSIHAKDVHRSAQHSPQPKAPAGRYVGGSDGALFACRTARPPPLRVTQRAKRLLQRLFGAYPLYSSVIATSFAGRYQVLFSTNT